MHDDYVFTADELKESDSTFQHEKTSSGSIALGRVSLAFKRFMDIFGSIFGLVLFSPLMLFVIWKIKHDDPGPAFYRHERLGRNGEVFNLWKFRTMVCNADRILHNVLNSDPEMKKEWEESYKLKKDPRITKFGAFLRRTSIDELPQLFNVLVGDMSLVGPRPIIEEEVAKYGKSYELRKTIRPGVTGMWQVSGRIDLTYPERVALDQWYIENWSIWLDIKIILKTIWVVLSGRGAY